MELLLVNPGDPFRGTTFTRIRTLTLPSVAAEFSGLATVRVVDENVQELPDRPFDLVGITCDTTHSTRAYALADRYRDAGTPVLLGGTHPSAMPEEALEHCDAVVVGEVEGLGERIVADLAAGRLAGRYRSPKRPDLSAVPVAPVDLLPEYGQYFKPYPFELTRGCRNACRFCFNRYVHGPGFRRRDVDAVVDAIARRPEPIALAMDDNLMNDPEHLAAFAERMVPLGKRWGGQSTLELGDDPELLRLLQASGFTFTFVGLESFSEASLRGEAKTFNQVGRYREQFIRLRAFGVVPFAGVILGLDGDGPEVFERTGEALRHVAPAAVAFTTPVAYPGTAFYRQVVKQDRLLCSDRSRYDGHHVVIRPLGMSAEALQRGYHRLARSFYGWRAGLSRLARYLARPMNLPRRKLVPSQVAITLGYRRFHQRLAREVQGG